MRNNYKNKEIFMYNLQKILYSDKNIINNTNNIVFNIVHNINFKESVMDKYYILYKNVLYNILDRVDNHKSLGMCVKVAPVKPITDSIYEVVDYIRIPLFNIDDCSFIPKDKYVFYKDSLYYNGSIADTINTIFYEDITNLCKNICEIFTYSLRIFYPTSLYDNMVIYTNIKKYKKRIQDIYNNTYTIKDILSEGLVIPNIYSNKYITIDVINNLSLY